MELARSNRTTESHILNEVAAIKGQNLAGSRYKVFLVTAWHCLRRPISNCTWNLEQGVIPGIHSTETVADDVFDENLEILLK